jgi:hypothetical protein
VAGRGEESSRRGGGGDGATRRRWCLSTATAAHGLAVAHGFDKGSRSCPTPNRSINREYRMIRQTTRRLCGLIGSCLLIEVLGLTRTINRD